MSNPSIRLGFLTKSDETKNSGSLRNRKPPFNLRLPFVGGDDLSIAELTSVDIGAKDKAGFRLLVLLYGVVIRMDLSLDLPLAGLEGRARCGTAFASVAFVFRQMRGRHVVILPALGQGRQGLLSGLGCAKALGLEVKELLV